MLLDVVDRLFTDLTEDGAMRRARAGEWLGEAWSAVEEMGLPLALVPEEKGGFGIAASDALAIVRLTGRHALPLPLAETMLANHLLAEAGLPLAQGPASIAVAAGAPVPWGRFVRTLVRETSGGGVERVDSWTVTREGRNLANMPRDAVAFATDGSAATHGGLPVLAAGAAIRALQIAGAMERVVELTATHVSERQQFGRPISKFQVVQHEIAKLASEAAAASAAADMAAEGFLRGAAGGLAIAAARVRSGEAVGIGTSVAQQMHGAIGFTEEHRLHWYTTSLWSWRDEFGTHSHWAQKLGAAALAAGGAQFWQFVTEAA